MTGIRAHLDAVLAGATRLGAALLPAVIRRSFAAKFFAGVVLVVLITGSVGAYNYLSVDERLESNAEQELVATAELQADGLDRWLVNTKLQTRMLSNQDVFDSRDSQAISLHLEDTVYSGVMSGEVEAIHYISLSSTEVIASSDEDLKGTNLADEGVRWTEGDLSVELYNYESVRVTSDTYDSPATDGPAIAFISPTRWNPDNAVVVVVNATEIANSFRQTTDGATTEVLNADGEVVLTQGADGDRSIVETHDEMNETLLTAGLDGESGFQAESATVAGFSSVESEDWVVVTYAPQSAIFSLKQQVTWSILTTIFASVAVLGVIAAIGGNAARSLRRLSGKLGEMETGDLRVELESRRSDEIGRLYEASASMRDSLRETIAEAETEREEAEVARREAERARELAEENQSEAERAKREAERTSALLVATAEEYRDVMDACADGDLTRRLDDDVDSDAMSAIAESFNEMIARWEGILADIRRFADDVADESEVVTEHVGAVSAAGAEVSRSTQDISEGAIEQRDDLSEITDEMSALSATIEEMAASADEVATVSQEAAERGESGREAAGAAIEEMTEIETRAEATADEVVGLREEIARIGEIVELIEEIAGKTNILALNASIEAARAGEHGDGFAVVAEEIKDLAEQSQTQAAEIEEMIDGITDDVDVAVDALDRNDDRVERGVEEVDDAVENFEEIGDSVDELKDAIAEVATATDQQAASTEEVAALVDETAESADEVAEETHAIGSAVEEQTAMVTQVNESVAELVDDLEE